MKKNKQMSHLMHIHRRGGGSLDEGGAKGVEATVVEGHGVVDGDALAHPGGHASPPGVGQGAHQVPVLAYRVHASCKRQKLEGN